MVPVNFHQLYYFWVIARAGSISAARGQLFLTQSTLSMQIKQLETALKRKLLTRGRHGVALTPEGQVAYRYCEQIFGQADEMVALFKSGKTMAAPVLRLGVKNSVSREKVLAVLEYLGKSAPDLQVRILSGSAEDLHGRFLRRQLDFAISDVDFSPDLGTDFRSRLVARIPLYFVATPSVKRKVGVFPQGLQNVPLLSGPPDNPTRREAENYLRKKRVSVSIGAEVENIDFIRILILKSKGVGVLDPLTLKEDLRLKRLEKLHRHPIEMHKNLWFISGNYRGSDPRLRRALDGLMENFRLRF